ncbi:MAG: hypothetical protein EBE86_032870 [Hormoscilla sp. GUM202]|nr:hypothetical protein [Hormoscilla sp. GUM202]
MRKWLGMNAPGDNCFNRRPAMSDVGVEELAEILEKDNEWLAEHYNEMIRKYPGKTIAVHDGEVVAVGDREIEDYCATRQNSVGPLILDIPHPDDLMPFII